MIVFSISNILRNGKYVQQERNKEEKSVVLNRSLVKIRWPCCYFRSFCYSNFLTLFLFCFHLYLRSPIFFFLLSADSPPFLFCFLPICCCYVQLHSITFSFVFLCSFLIILFPFHSFISGHLFVFLLLFFTSVFFRTSFLRFCPFLFSFRFFLFRFVPSPSFSFVCSLHFPSSFSSPTHSFSIIFFHVLPSPFSISRFPPSSFLLYPSVLRLCSVCLIISLFTLDTNNVKWFSYTTLQSKRSFIALQI